MRLLRGIGGFVACLFEAHAFEYDFHRDWLVCHRCHTARLRCEELASLLAHKAREPVQWFPPPFD